MGSNNVGKVRIRKTNRKGVECKVGGNENLCVGVEGGGGEDSGESRGP